METPNSKPGAITEAERRQLRRGPELERIIAEAPRLVQKMVDAGLMRFPEPTTQVRVQYPKRD